MALFANQVAVVTGASSGIGKAIALSLAAQGAMLCIVGRKLEALLNVARSIQTETRVLTYQIDLTLDEDIQELKSRLQQDFGQVNLLVHSAGMISCGKIETASVDDFDWQYRTNVRAPYAITQALLPLLVPHQGQIVFINSSAGLTNARANVGQYAATKHGLKAIADSLRDEVNADGVRVLSVFPGRTASSMQAAVHEMEGKAYYPEQLLQPEDVAAVVINALSLPRTAEVTDVSIRPLVKSK